MSVHNNQSVALPWSQCPVEIVHVPYSLLASTRSRVLFKEEAKISLLNQQVVCAACFSAL